MRFLFTKSKRITGHCLNHVHGKRCKFEPLESRIVLTVSFTNVASELGFVTAGSYLGAAWFDFNHDGLEDIFVNNGQSSSQLFRNDGNGKFTDLTHVAGDFSGNLAIEQADLDLVLLNWGVQTRRLPEGWVGNPPSGRFIDQDELDSVLLNWGDQVTGNGLTGITGAAAVVSGDLDNDGNVDLILSGSQRILLGDQTLLRVFRNLGDGTFAETTATSGIIPPNTPGGASLADVDGDGFLDLFVTATGNFSTQQLHASKIYRNNGDFTFTDMTGSSGVDASMAACASGFSDYDMDGDVDLFVANCNDQGSTPMQLFRNDGDFLFADVTEQSGLATIRGFWMAVTFADYDNDQDVDLFVTNIANGQALIDNNGDGTFMNVASGAGVAAWEFGWGATFTDLDNDGFDDIFYAGTFSLFDWVGPERGNPGRLFFNNLGSETPSKTFTEMSDNLGIDLREAWTSGVASADYDDDGFIDLLVMAQDRASGESATVLLHNDGNSNNWLGAELEGTVSNRDAVGARITVESGDLVQVQEIYAGTSFLSTDSQSLRFGLGSREGVDVVRIQWPSGMVDEWNSISGVNQILQLTEGDGDTSAGRSAAQWLPGDYDGSGQINQRDLDLALLHWGQDTSKVDAGWVSLPGTAAIDQDELGAVLLNWGRSLTDTAVSLVPPAPPALEHTEGTTRRAITPLPRKAAIEFAYAVLADLADLQSS